MNIYQKLIEVRKAVPYLKKEAESRQYNYTASSQVLASVRETMNEVGLMLVPKILDTKVTQTAGKTSRGNEVITYFTELVLEMVWVNAEKPEETIVIPWYGQGVDIAGEKGVGKALTYAEKYLILKTFNIPTDQDDPDRFQSKYYEMPEPLNKSAKIAPTPKKPEPDDPDEKEKLISQVAILCSEQDRPPEWIEESIKKRFKKNSLQDLTNAQLQNVINGLRKAGE